MHVSRKLGVRTLLFAATTLALGSIGIVPAQAETVTETNHDIPFSRLHQCTFEDVEGPTTVHMTVTVTTGDDGVKQIHTKQHTHGSQMIGTTSGDTYNFNDSLDEHSHFVGSAPGHFTTRTRFIHHGEDLANIETPGMDDLHQTLTIFVPQDGPPTIVKQEFECR